MFHKSPKKSRTRTHGERERELCINMYENCAFSYEIEWILEISNFAKKINEWSC
jgi:hypothetical protein